MKGLITLLKAVAEENRLRILHLLAHKGELCVCDIERVLAFPPTRASKHLNKLELIGLIDSRKVATWKYYSLNQPANRVHARLLRSIKEASDTVEELRRDLDTFEALRAAKKLDSCSPCRAAARK